MIPLRLHLHNFMSYADNVAPLSFEGMHLVSLSGDNGHGKSALLDAMTWALWGKARSNHDDELMRIGSIEMRVEFDFEMGGDCYRILRRRARRGRSGQTGLEFQLVSGDLVQPLTGNSIADTQRRIVEVLKLDYDTFINSAYLRQGHADEFTLRTPAERKQVLATILGLSFYDDLCDKARRAAQACEAERRAIDLQIAQRDEEITSQPAHEAKLRDLDTKLVLLEAQRKESETKVEWLQTQRRDLDAKADELARLVEQRQRYQSSLTQIEQTIRGHQKRISEHQSLLARRSEIELGYTHLRSARKEEADASQRLANLRPLEQQRQELLAQVEASRQEIVAEHRVVSEAIRLLEQRTHALPGLEKELASVRQRLLEMEKQKRQRDDALELRQVCRTELELKKSANERLEAEGLTLKEKVDLLQGEGAICPLCGSQLGEDGREDLKARLMTEREALRRQYADNRERIRSTEGRDRATQELIADLDRSLREMPAMQRREGEITGALDTGRQAQAEIERQTARRNAIDTLLAAEDYAHQTKRLLGDIERQISNLGYEPQAHQEARNRIISLASYEQQYNELDVAGRLLQSEQDALVVAQANAVERNQELVTATSRETGLKQDLQQKPQVDQDLMVAEKARQTRRQDWTDAIGERGRLQQLLARCEQAAGERSQLQAKQQALAVDKAIYSELAEAYGRNGIQAMLIDGVLPELEEEANSLLDRMTHGRMRVRFQTQRQARSRDQVLETLDIIISDDIGSRPYELYSGGEAFRANFAIRVALSKLLARRAGAQLQTLIIDEGFGTQDTQGRERLVEAISSVSQDFERILVISHIDELKDAFPARIEVIKTEEGSQLSVYGI